MALASPGSDDSQRPNDPTSYTAATQDVPQSASIQDAIDSTVANLDADVLTSVLPGDAPDPDHWQGTWLYMTVRGAQDRDGATLASAWQADLAQGAIAERVAGDKQNLADVIAGSVIEFVADDGSHVAVQGGAGDIVPGQFFDADGQSDSALVADIERVLTEYGLVAERVRILHPLDSAAYVKAKVTRPDQFTGRFDALRTSILGSPPILEGLYLEIDLGDGAPLVRSSVALRSGAGRLWVAPGYEDMVSAAHGAIPN
ncbi:MAG: hypothetical protein QM714_11875 [Nocardioides sp.]|uniref:hypothetical protein n=1 Tax=Nocardioides sp. TaxID=35761 RepID=UPI0039E6E9A5